MREIIDLLPNFYKIYSPKDYKLKSPKENGKSFLENSLIKAKYFSLKTKKICIYINIYIYIAIYMIWYTLVYIFRYK